MVTPNEHKPLSGRRVLVVEDEYFLANDIERSLQSLGAEVAGPVGYLEDGLEIVNGISALDGAVLDVNIGGEMVYPLARELRRRRLPFVFTSGYAPVVVVPEFADTPLFEKPIDIVAVAARFTEMMQEKDAAAGSSPA